MCHDLCARRVRLGRLMQAAVADGMRVFKPSNATTTTTTTIVLSEAFVPIRLAPLEPSANSVKKVNCCQFLCIAHV